MSATILHRLLDWAQSEPNTTAQSYKKGGQWHPITSKEFADRVFWIALYLESKGMRPEDTGTILSYNCPEWTHFELGFELLGGLSAGLYPNSTPREALYIIEHSKSRFLVIQNRETYERLLTEANAQSVLSQLTCVIVLEGDAAIAPQSLSYSSVIIQGQRLALAEPTRSMRSFLEALDPKAPSFIIYTSGTTGIPKAALLSQENLTFASDTVVSHWNLPSKGQGSMFSFLPLSHIAEKLQSIGVGITQQYCVAYCTKFENVSEELPEIQPELLVCVPRVWEKIMEGVMKKLARSPAWKSHLILWAMQVTRTAKEASYRNQERGLSDAVQTFVASKLLIGKIKKALGLSRIKALASGAAPLPAKVAQWYWGLDLEILEDYGQTETTGILSMTIKDKDCSGTVGKGPNGIEIKIAEDGEILTRGKHVFVGYLNDEAATKATFEKGGWLKTGDLGVIDEQGFLCIRGRKKELIKTSGGKMIAPLPIEESLRLHSLISQICMVGEGRKYLAAIVTLKEEVLKDLHNKPGSIRGELIVDPDTLDALQSAIDEVNARLASFEQIKKFAVLSQDFSIAGGQLTPTLKIKRHVIEKQYWHVIEGMFEQRAEAS